MTVRISRLAEVDSKAKLGLNVEIGPFCHVGPHVSIDNDTKLDSHVAITGHTTIGKRNHFFPNSVIGAMPQDVGFTGAPTRVEIGNDNTFREGVTVNRGAEKEDHCTRIENQNMLMANSHVAHNCHVFNNVILVNGVLLGGHVHVHDGAIISGNSAVHHFCTLGKLSFIGGCCRVTRDLPPFMMSVFADHPTVKMINLIGMRRADVPEDVIRTIKHAHRMIYREGKKLDEIHRIFEEKLNGDFPDELIMLLDFVKQQFLGKSGRGREAYRNQESTNDEQIQRRAA